MSSLSSYSVSQYKSSFRSLAFSFFHSREKLREKFKKLTLRKRALEEQHQQVVEENRALKRRLAQSQSALLAVQSQLTDLESRPTQLPPDPLLPNHQFGARMISFCTSMCNTIGFRPTEQVLPLIQKWLNIEFNIPSRWTMRLWSSRNGVAILKESSTVAADWIWLVDHSVQLGKMFVLVILGIRQSDLPIGRALQRSDMHPLAVVPATSRSKDEVGEMMVKLSSQIGAPISIVIDGASELHQGAKWLENLGFEVVVMDDVKHKAANILKKTLGKEPRFIEFEAQVGKTTAQIQQTELEHLLPPKKKNKCRFMNLGKLIDWAQMAVLHLKDPAAPGNQKIDAKRLKEKLGWLLAYQDELESWRESRQVVSSVLEFTNSQGVYPGVTDDLRARLGGIKIFTPLAQEVRDQLLEVCAENERKLSASSYAGLRLSCSTEILESSLGSFKALQRNHNRGTFTSLLAVYATLFGRTTPQQIRKRFAKVTNKVLKEWLKQAGLTNSTQARKTAAYKYTKASIE